MKALAISFLLLCAASVEGCTGLRMTAKDGSSVNGRTVEFGTLIDTYACFIPRDYAFVGKTPAGEGLHYTSKYAVLGAYCFNDKVLMDGINEKGLSCGAFYFPGLADYAPTDESNQKRSLSPVDFPNWILTQFASLEELAKALASDAVAIAPTVIEGWGPTPPPFHYVVYDKAGNSLVIEPLKGRLVTYENKIGVITNSPSFDWHLNNLRNYINLSPFNIKAVTLRGVELAPFGQGSGMVGLPGDFSPPSRFVRAAIFSSTATAVDTYKELVGQTFHLLNQFDIPLGVAREKVSYEGQELIATDYTLLTSVKDPNNLRYYFRSYEDPTIKAIALSDFDVHSTAIQSAQIKGAAAGVDVNTPFEPFALK